MALINVQWKPTYQLMNMGVVYPCPHCKNESETYLYKGFGWMNCQNCGKNFRSKDIPEEIRDQIMSQAEKKGGRKRSEPTKKEKKSRDDDIVPADYDMSELTDFGVGNANIDDDESEDNDDDDSDDYELDDLLSKDEDEEEDEEDDDWESNDAYQEPRIVRVWSPRGGRDEQHHQQQPPAAPRRQQQQQQEKRRMMQREREEEEEEDEEERGVPIERIKEPHEILFEVLKDYGVKKRAAKFIMRRAQRTFISPSELASLLRTLKSGLKTQEEIKLLCDDYYYALEKEREKAYQLRAARQYYPSPRPYGDEEDDDIEYIPRPPATTRQRFAHARSPVDPRDYYHDDSDPYWRDPMARRKGGQPQQQQNPFFVLDPILKAWEYMDSRTRNTQEMTKVEMLERQVQALMEAVKQLPQAMQQQQQKNDGLTREDLLLILKELKEDKMEKSMVTKDDLGSFAAMMGEMMKEFKQDRLLQALEKKLEEERNEKKEMINRYERTIEKMEERIEDLRRELVKRESGSIVKEFEDDKMKIVAQTTSKLLDKEPVRALVDGAIKLQQLEKGGAEKTKKAEKLIESGNDEDSEIIDLLPDDMIEDEDEG